MDICICGHAIAQHSGYTVMSTVAGACANRSCKCTEYEIMKDSLKATIEELEFTDEEIETALDEIYKLMSNT